MAAPDMQRSCCLHSSFSALAFCEYASRMSQLKRDDQRQLCGLTTVISKSRELLPSMLSQRTAEPPDPTSRRRILRFDQTSERTAKALESNA